METSKICIGFRGQQQTPLVMVWKEYYDNNDIVYAEVIFSIDDIFGLFKYKSRR